jgi:hypothetical protein
MKVFDLVQPILPKLKHIKEYPLVIKHMKRYGTISALHEFELGEGNMISSIVESVTDPTFVSTSSANHNSFPNHDISASLYTLVMKFTFASDVARARSTDPAMVCCVRGRTS